MNLTKRQQVLEVVALLKEKLKCPICLDNIQNCAQLNCSHTFCKGCLDEHWKSAKTEHVCPMCKQPYKRRQKIFENKFVGELTNFVTKASELIQESCDIEVEAIALKSAPSTSKDEICSLKSNKLWNRKVRDEPFDKLLDKTRRCYANKRKSASVEIPVLPFKETKAKDTILSWLKDANEKLVAFSQKSQKLENWELQNTSRIVCASNLSGRKRSQSLNLDKREKILLLKRSQSLTEDLYGFYDYSIEEINSEKIIQNVERKVVQDILEDKCLDDLDDLVQKALNPEGSVELHKSVLNPEGSDEKTFKCRKEKKQSPTNSANSGWERIKNVKMTIKSAGKFPKRLNISLQSEGKLDTSRKSKKTRTKLEKVNNQLEDWKKNNDASVDDKEDDSLESKSEIVAKKANNSDPDSSDIPQKNKAYNLALLETYFCQNMVDIEPYVTKNSNKDSPANHLKLCLNEDVMIEATHTDISDIRDVLNKNNIKNVDISKPRSNKDVVIEITRTNISNVSKQINDRDVDIYSMPTQKSVESMAVGSTESKHDTTKSKHTTTKSKVEVFHSQFELISKVVSNESSIDRILQQLGDNLEKCVQKTLDIQDPVPHSLIDCFLNLKSYVEKAQDLRKYDRKLSNVEVQTDRLPIVNQCTQTSLIGFEGKNFQAPQKLEDEEKCIDDLLTQPLAQLNSQNDKQSKFNPLLIPTQFIGNILAESDKDLHSTKTPNLNNPILNRILEKMHSEYQPPKLPGEKSCHNQTQDSVLILSVPSPKTINRRLTFGGGGDSTQKRFKRIKRPAADDGDESDQPEHKRGHKQFIRDDLTVKFVDSQATDMEIDIEDDKMLDNFDYDRYLEEVVGNYGHSPQMKPVQTDSDARKNKKTFHTSQQTGPSTSNLVESSKIKEILKSQEALPGWHKEKERKLLMIPRESDGLDKDIAMMCKELIFESEDVMGKNLASEVVSQECLKNQLELNKPYNSNSFCNRTSIPIAGRADSIARNTADQIQEMLNDIRNDSFFDNIMESQMAIKSNILSQAGNVNKVNTESTDIIESTPGEDVALLKSRITISNIKNLKQPPKSRKTTKNNETTRVNTANEIQDMLEDVRNDPAFFNTNMESQVTGKTRCFQIDEVGKPKAIQPIENSESAYYDIIKGTAIQTENKLNCKNMNGLATKVSTLDDDIVFEDALIEAELGNMIFTAEERKLKEQISSKCQILQNIKIKSQNRSKDDIDDTDVVYGTPEKDARGNDRRVVVDLPYAKSMDPKKQPFGDIFLSPPPGFGDDIANTSPSEGNTTSPAHVELTESIVTSEPWNLSRKFGRLEVNVQDKSIIISGRNGSNNSHHSTPRSQFKEIESLGFSPIKEHIETPKPKAKMNPIVAKPSTTNTTLMTSTPNQKSILNYIRPSEEPLVSKMKKPCITWSRIINKDMNCFTQLEVKKLISVSHTWGPDVTHLVVLVDDRGRLKSYTAKYLLAVAHGAWVVRYEWVQDCAKYGKIVVEEPYEVLDLSGTCGPKISRLSQGKNPLFRDYTFFCPPPFQLISKNGVETAVQKLGAQIVASVKCLERKGSRIGLIISDSTATEDMDQFQEYLTNFNVVTVDVEWLAKCIGQYKINSVRPYLLCSDDNVHELGYPSELVESVPFTLTEGTNLGN